MVYLVQISWINILMFKVYTTTKLMFLLKVKQRENLYFPKANTSTLFLRYLHKIMYNIYTILKT
jgi:hypothetical protein